MGSTLDDESEASEAHGGRTGPRVEEADRRDGPVREQDVLERGGRGAAKSEVLAVVTKELAEAGLQSTIVLGPLLLKTNGKETAEQGGQLIVLPMPILVTSTYTVMQKATSQAYKKLADGGDDPEMVLGKGRKKSRSRSDTTRGEGWQARWQRRHSREENARRRISVCILDGC